MRVLIVDDNASMRNLLSALLGSQGYEVVGALEDGNGVLDAVRRLRPETVCLDYQLPGRNGLEILAEINETQPEIDVVFMTGSSDGDIDARAADAGAAGFLRKPFGQQQVLDELRQVRQTRAKASRGTAAALASDLADEIKHPAGRGPTAVIADDNSSIRLLMRGLLNELGIQVVAQATNGEEAIRAAAKLQPQLLFLDVNMPILSGLDALPRIRETSPQTTVVMVTGEASREMVSRAMGLGARGYIVKPVRPAYVENFIKKLLSP